MKVTPKNDDVRKTLQHPTAGGFRAEGPADWPEDTFTFRRIRDGDITAERSTPPDMKVKRFSKPNEGA